MRGCYGVPFYHIPFPWKHALIKLVMVDLLLWFYFLDYNANVCMGFSQIWVRVVLVGVLVTPWSKVNSQVWSGLGKTLEAPRNCNRKCSKFWKQLYLQGTCLTMDKVFSQWSFSTCLSSNVQNNWGSECSVIAVTWEPFRSLIINILFQLPFNDLCKF